MPSLPLTLALLTAVACCWAQKPRIGSDSDGNVVVETGPTGRFKINDVDVVSTVEQCSDDLSALEMEIMALKASRAAMEVWMSVIDDG